MKTNCYDVESEMIIVGSCLKRMQPDAFDELTRISPNIYEVCLEETHLNMVITKLGGMLSRVKVNKLIFATVDRSPHCIQMHYIENELQKMMNLTETRMIHYVAVENKLIEVSSEKIQKSKCLSES